MSAVRKWLESINLDQYADAFETNDIDMDLLTQVDDQILKDIGISSVGHRLRGRVRPSRTRLIGRHRSLGRLSVDSREIVTQLSFW